jgi:YebC/PmpR family DNA-binding regulatory protein
LPLIEQQTISLGLIIITLILCTVCIFEEQQQATMILQKVQQYNRPVYKTLLSHVNENKLQPTSIRLPSILNSQAIRWAGHNKWSKIRHKKGAKDMNRAKLFAKATKAIRVASRNCGGDLENLNLQSAVQAAKSLQVPKDRIEDAIQNAKSSSSETELVTQRYDGHIVTPSGKVAVIALALTDNKNRTAANLRAMLRKSNGDMLNTGANDWLFDHVGVALVQKQKTEFEGGKDASAAPKQASDVDRLSEEEEDELMECALEGGAIDVDFGAESDDHVLLKSEPADLHPLVMAMKSGGYMLSEFESTYLVKDDGAGGSTTIQLDEESTDHFETFTQKIEDDEDVSNIYHNASLFDDENAE